MLAPLFLLTLRHLHHSSPAFRLPYASARRSSLVEVVEVVAVVLCEVAVDDRPGHGCKHSSGPAPLAFTADRSVVRL